MIQSIKKTQINYYQISIFLLAFSILGTLYYFWNQGLLNGSQARRLYQTSYIVESYEKNPLLRHVKSLVEKEDYKLAITKIRELEKEFKQVQNYVKAEEYKSLQSNFQNLKLATTNLLSYSQTSKVLAVFNIKMDKFYDYVRENKWRTLTRMSQRVYSITQIAGGPKSIDSLVKNVNKDFSAMLKITRNSVLSESEKAEVISRIKNLQVEMTMLEKYSSQLAEFATIYEKAVEGVEKWMASIAPQLILEKIKLDEIGKTFIFALACLFLMSLSLLAGGLFVARLRANKELVSLENILKRIVDQRLIAGDKPSLMDDFSPDFRTYCEKMSRYINKRMSMGAIFQETLPLSSILLDENLKVIWSNKRFCEEWSIDTDEIKKDYINWDFLNKLTNIGQDDPVIEALKHGVAGIYQIQVKPCDDLTTRPFEMFVSPVNCGDERRIQLFFYDLRSLEQTIKDQAQGLINPIKDILKQLRAGEPIMHDELRQQFILAGIKDVFDLFEGYRAQNESERKNSWDQIEIAEARIERLESNLTYVKEQLEQNITRGKESAHSLKVFRDAVIALAQQARELDHNLKRSVGVINTNINAISNSKTKLIKSLGLVQEVSQEAPALNNLKNELKIIRQEFQYGLSQVVKGVSHSEDRQHHKRLSDLGASLDQKITHMELHLSKLDMIVATVTAQMTQLNTDHESQHIDISRKEVKSLLPEGSLEQIENSEAIIVEELQHMFTGTRSQLKSNCDAYGQIVN